MVKVIGVGNPMEDRSVDIPTKSLPAGLTKGTTSVTESLEIVEQTWNSVLGTDLNAWSRGGSSATIMKCLAWISHFSCELLGMVGTDKKQIIETELNDFGVNSLLQETETKNGLVNCFVTEDAERTMQAFLGASQDFKKEHILPQYFENVDHTHLEGYLAYADGILEESVKHARPKKGSTISLDLSDVKAIEFCGETLKKCAEQVDIIFGNLEEMRKFTGCTSPQAIVGEFQSHQIVVITNGAKGCWVRFTDENNKLQLREFKALQVPEVIGTTGAGDFFIAGFLLGFLKQGQGPTMTATKIKTCIDLAKLMASYVIQQKGTNLPQDTLHKLKNDIKKNLMNYS